jgi:TfoX/Sxy family transcriptional regulator of competence genes
MSRTDQLKDSHAKFKKDLKAKFNPKQKAPKKGGPKTNRDCHLALRVTTATYKEVESAAHDTHRTASNWVETAILWALKEGAVKTRQVVPRPKGE